MAKEAKVTAAGDQGKLLGAVAVELDFGGRGVRQENRQSLGAWILVPSLDLSS